MNHISNYKSLCLVLVLSMLSVNAFSWGQKGHDVTCAIAQRHLSHRAEKKIAEIFDGKSIIYWCNWPDNAKNTPEYKYTETWHYKNVDAGVDYDSVEPFVTGDVVTAVCAQIQALKSGELDKEHQAVALRLLVHLVGDIHCPMHIGHASDRGGNNVQVQYFGKGSNLHRVWDSGIIDSTHQWGYNDWAEQLDILGREEVEKIVKGEPNDWARQNWTIVGKIYDATPSGAKLSYDYSNAWTPVIEQQLLFGGLRLAHVLNDIFK